MKRKKITIDELLEKMPNKYELAIISGKIAKKEFMKGCNKSEIMDNVFDDIMNDEVVVIGSQKNVENEITEKITLRQVAKWAGTIQDDVLTKFLGIKKTVD